MRNKTEFIEFRIQDIGRCHPERSRGICLQTSGTLTKPLIVLLVICLFGRAAEAQYGGGSGEPNDPYLIYTAEDLNEIDTESGDSNKHFKLMADIDLKGITYSTVVIQSLQGTLDGNGFTINNLTIVDGDWSGLIGLIGRFGQVCNLGVADASVTGWSQSGILVVRNSGDVTNCYSTGIVSGETDVGGLVGINLGNVSNCYSTATVTGEWTQVGGLIGDNSSSRDAGAVTNCYSTGSVSGRDQVGGLVGKNRANVSNCYSTGTVSSSGWFVGGLIGDNNGDVIKSFWDIESSGQSWSFGGTGKTIAEMQMASTFTDVGWDFVDETENGNEDIWSICEGTNYPRFVWQIPVGDFVCPDGVTTVDFSFFATHWLDDNCDPGNNYCDCIDIDASGKVDFNDLSEFADNWLAEGMWILYIIVDDFESYNDLDPNDPMSNRIFYTWSDGYYDEANGSTVGYSEPDWAAREHFVETTIVHGGSQSMPYFYDTDFMFSKAELPLSPPQDWTEEGVGVLSLWFYGDSSNAAARMSFVLNGSPPVYHDNPNAVQIDVWTEWTTDLQAFEGVDLNSINSIAICFGEENNPQPGGSGMVLFDDIRLYRSGCM
jgi:hypothetical protein